MLLVVLFRLLEAAPAHNVNLKFPLAARFSCISVRLSGVLSGRQNSFVHFCKQVALFHSFIHSSIHSFDMRSKFIWSAGAKSAFVWPVCMFKCDLMSGERKRERKQDISALQ